MRVRQLDLARAGQHVLIWGRDIDNAGKHDFAVLGLFYMQGSVAQQQVREKTFSCRVKVLYHQNAAGKVRRQRTQQLGNGMKAPG